MENKNKVDILPNSKVGAVLDAYPELEDVFIEISPAFIKLKNPVLRKTVAKFASLQKAAVVGKVDLFYMLNTLREKVGLTALTDVNAEPIVISNIGLSDKNIVATIDVRPIVDAGDSPKDKILLQAEMLKEGEAFILISSFVPMPIFELLKKKNFKVDLLKNDGDYVETLIEK